ncbi:MAG: TetR/AcrR family transcriptional regulator [Phycisphaerae bacterium]|nr:TetR/AcrR family transcriptional regulator [Phycisphaerae bacterium]
MTTATTDRRDQIMQVAAHLFRERGFHATSVREIADAVGLQGGSLYAHVDSKDDLLWEIVNRSADRFFEALSPVLNSDLDILHKLRDAITTHVGVITADLDAAAVYTTEWRHLPPDRQSQIAERRDEYESRFRSLVRQGIREGFLSPVDEAYATLFILSTLNYLYLWYRPGGRMSSEAVARLLADFIFDGLRRRTT